MGHFPASVLLPVAVIGENKMSLDKQTPGQILTFIFVDDPI